MVAMSNAHHSRREPIRGDPFPDGIPGVIDGSLTIRAEPGCLAFHVLCQLDGRRGTCSGLVELIIDAKHIGELSRALTPEPAADPVSELPCRIGFSLGGASIQLAPRGTRTPLARSGGDRL